MPRKLLKVIIVGAAVALAGCDNPTSTAYPEDGRDQSNPINNTGGDRLTGRALDGYLQNAFVWLDMNENAQWDEGEPSGETAEGGRFSLDISSLERDVSVGPDLDPDHYPLMLLATAGKTIDEDDGLAVEKNFLLLAPPGVRTISPFTTLIEFQRRLPGFVASESPLESVVRATNQVQERLGADLEGLNLQLDYLRGENALAAAYGQAITEFLARQTSEKLAGAGPGEMLEITAFQLLAGVTLGQVDTIIDQAAAEIAVVGVEEFNPDNLEFPTYGLDGGDPYVLHHQKLYMPPALEPHANPETVLGSQASIAGSAPNYKADNLSAEFQYTYDDSGRLVEVEVTGWTEPNLVHLQRLIQAEGYVSRLETQYSPGLLVRYSSAFARSEEPPPQERYVFNWDEDEIEWHTNNDTEDGSVPAALDDEPEGVISWSSGPIQLRRGETTRALEVINPETEQKHYTFRQNGDVVEEWDWAPATEPDPSLPEPPDFQCEQISVTATGTDWTFYDTYSIPTEDEERLLLNSTRMIEFTDGSPVPVAWDASYLNDTAGPAVDQRSLLTTRVLYHLAEPPIGCTVQPRNTDRALAVTTYDYLRLSTSLSR